MDEQEKKSVVEWSFSFEKLGESINEQIRNIGLADEEVKHEHFSAGLGGAKSANVKLSLSVGRVGVKALVDSDNLIDADVAYTGEMNFEVSGESEKTVRLGQKSHTYHDVAAPIKDVVGKIMNHEELRWDVGLTPTIPLNLDIDCGVGENRLDLSELNITRVKLNGGIGENRLLLPAMDSTYPVKIKSGVGSVKAEVAEGASVRLNIEGGVGAVHVRVPANAAVRVTLSTGLGGASLPSHFRRIKGGNDFISQNGVWETEGYALASQQIQIEFKGGVGGFKVSTAAAE